MNTDSEDDWICTHCDWKGDVSEIKKVRVFTATQEEPDEWLWYCPGCDRTDDLEEKYENAQWCKTCEDVIVKNEGEQCAECHTCQAEELSDRARGH